MKYKSVLALALTSMLSATVCPASDTHEADRGLEGSLRTAINERHVHIDVHRGIVTLEGRVSTDADRQRIESLVRNTTGVVAVKDELRVAFPSPGTYGANSSTIPGPTVPGSTIPVYTTPLPEVVVPPATVVTRPAPVIIPEYPKLKVQAWTSDDEPTANRIARQLRVEDVPTAGIENVNILVRNGNVSLQGMVETHEDREAIIGAIQRAGDVRAIYDQLQIK